MRHTPLRNIRLCALLLILTAVAVPAVAQVVKVDSLSEWRHAFKAGLNLNEALFSENWKGGGVSTIGFNALINYKANYKSHDRSWDNEVDLLYGMVINETLGPRKAMDRIFIDSKYGHNLRNPLWNAFFAVNLQTQFTKGFSYEKDSIGVEQEKLKSQSFSPLFITGSMGFEYKPSTDFKLRLSPIAPRITYLTDNDGRYAEVDEKAPYGVKVGETFRFEWWSFQLYTEFARSIAKDMTVKVRYVMYVNYQTLEANKVDHRIDLDWTAKLTRFIDVNISGIYVYDFDQDISPQYSQAFSLGILYTFQNYAEKK